MCVARGLSLLSLGPPPAVRIGGGVAGDRAEETGLGEKTVTPAFCPDVKEKLEIPQTELIQPSKFKNIHIPRFTNKNSKHKFLNNLKQYPN